MPTLNVCLKNTPVAKLTIKTTKLNPKLWVSDPEEDHILFAIAHSNPDKVEPARLTLDEVRQLIADLQLKLRLYG